MLTVLIDLHNMNNSLEELKRPMTEDQLVEYLSNRINRASSSPGLKDLVKVVTQTVVAAVLMKVSHGTILP